MTDFDEIPVLDAAALTTGDPKGLAELARDFADAYGRVGFGYIVNHGVPPEMTEAVFDASRRFHALPMARKMAVALDRNHRGFIPIDSSTDVTSTLAVVEKPNQSESFMVMREDAPGDPDMLSGAYLAGPNQWPELAGFREAVSAYAGALSDLGRQLMQVALTAVGADPATVMPAFDRPTTWLRLLRYPPRAADAAADLYGAAPHKDFGCLTILAQDDVGGLQVMTPSGDWIDAPRLPGAFVVNVGDMLHRWSNGRLLSTPHRVINRSGRERYSCPFFYDPNVSTDIAPLAACVTPDRPAAFDRLNFGDFLRGELEASYVAHQPRPGS